MCKKPTKTTMTIAITRTGTEKNVSIIGDFSGMLGIRTSHYSAPLINKAYDVFGRCGLQQNSLGDWVMHVHSYMKIWFGNVSG